jgi:hypothetical protein
VRARAVGAGRCVGQLLEQQNSLHALVAQGAAQEARLEENAAKFAAKLAGAESDEFIPRCNADRTGEVRSGCRRIYI